MWQYKNASYQSMSIIRACISIPSLVMSQCNYSYYITLHVIINKNIGQAYAQ